MGRKVGSKNRATLEREAQALKALAAFERGQRNHGSEASPTFKRGKDIMSIAANYFFDRAQAELRKAEPDRAMVAENYQIAADIASKVAPFESPRLASVTVGRRTDLSRLSDADLDLMERLLTQAAVADGDTGGAGQTAH